MMLSLQMDSLFNEIDLGAKDLDSGHSRRTTPRSNRVNNNYFDQTTFYTDENETKCIMGEQKRA